MPTNQEVNDLLTDYWNRRPLSQSEWADFYRVVRSVLMNCSAPQLASLPESPGGKEDYVAEFFVDKVLSRVSRDRRNLNVGALILFFRNYLIDKIRGLSDEDSLEDFANEDGEIPFADSSPDDPAVADFLRNRPIAEIEASANAFLDALEDWGRLMLSNHYCADNPVPMSTLCRGIKSYHHKAHKLGVTSSRRDGLFLGFKHSLIGKWMSSLNVELLPANATVVHFLLQILCLCALKQDGLDHG